MNKVEAVTELRIRREVAEQIRTELDRCQPRTPLDEISLFGWERRLHAPDRVHAAALRAHFDAKPNAETARVSRDDAGWGWWAAP